MAYHDLTAANSGGQYRAERVDIEKSTDAGGGFDVGWNQPGEWLNYTVKVPAGGLFDLDLRIAYGGANASGGTVHLEADGVNVSGAIALPKTAGWQSWQTVTRRNINLPAGVYTLKLMMDKDGAGSTAYLANVNWIKLSPLAQTPFPNPASPAALPGRVEAENFDNGGEGVGFHDLTAVNSGGQYRATAVDIEKSSDTGGGFDVGWNQPGEWLAYTTLLSTSGSYDLAIRTAYAGPTASGGTVHLESDGIDVSGPILLPKTGGWQTWQTVNKSGINLSAGQHVLRLVFDKDGAGSAANTTYLGNVNWIQIAAGAHAGQTDATFGSGGIAISSLVGTTQAIAVQPDGKVIVAGSTANGDFALVRFNANGGIDSSFGSGGAVTTDFGGPDLLVSIVLPADGGIIAGGVTDANPGGFALAKYTAAGALDPSFGTGGKVITNFYGGSDDLRALALDGQGRIVAVGATEALPGPQRRFMIVARYTANGALDPSFGGVGWDTFTGEGDEGFLNAAAATPDGGVVAAGGTLHVFRGNWPDDYDFFSSLFSVWQVKPDGTTTVKTLDVEGEVQAMAATADGRVILADNGKLVRLDPNLNLDPTFGGDGQVSLDGYFPRGVAAQRDGRIVVLVQPTGATGPARVERFNPDGSLDSTFADQGVATLSLASNSLALATDGRIAVASTSADDKLAATRLVNDAIPSPGTSVDVGAVGKLGTASLQNGRFTIQASGADIWGFNDAFRFVYQTLNGDGQIVARVNSLDNTDPWAKAGLMFRDGLAANARNVYMAVSPTSGTAFQYRPTAGSFSIGVAGPKVAAPTWLKLVRQGNTFRGYQSNDGQTWTLVGSQTISMGSSLLVGLASTAHSTEVLGTSAFSNVQVGPAL